MLILIFLLHGIQFTQSASTHFESFFKILSVQRKTHPCVFKHEINVIPNFSGIQNLGIYLLYYIYLLKQIMTKNSDHFFLYD